jgi:uncharacterized sulfatase
MGFTDGPGRDLSFVRKEQDDALRFLDEVGEQPFCMWWAPLLPHRPHNPPKKYRAMFTPEEIEIPPYISANNKEKFQRAEAVSYAMGAWMDEEIGKLMEKLRQRKLYKQTLVIMFIDNGWCNGRPSKGSVFERGLRTPLVFTWPGRIHAAQRFSQLASSIDIMPTILDYAGVPIPPSCSGVTLRPILEGRQEKSRGALFGAVFRRIANGGPSQGVYALYVRTGRWKYVYYVDAPQDNERFKIYSLLTQFPARDKGDEDLFDLKNDPDELIDLAGRPEYKTLVEKFGQQTLSWWIDTGGTPF